MAAKTISCLRLYGYVIVGEYEFLALYFAKLRRILGYFVAEKRSFRMSRFSLVNNNLPACCNAQNFVSACKHAGSLGGKRSTPREREIKLDSSLRPHLFATFLLRMDFGLSHAGCFSLLQWNLSTTAILPWEQRMHVMGR